MSLRHQVESLVYLDNSIWLSLFSLTFVLNKGSLDILSGWNPWQISLHLRGNAALAVLLLQKVLAVTHKLIQSLSTESSRWMQACLKMRPVLVSVSSCRWGAPPICCGIVSDIISTPSPSPWHIPTSHPTHCIQCFLYRLSHQITPYIKAMFLGLRFPQIPHVQVTLSLSRNMFISSLQRLCFSPLIRWASIPCYASDRVWAL